MPFTPDSRLGDVLDSAPGRAVVERCLPMVADAPFPVQIRHATVRQLVDLDRRIGDDPAAQAELYAALAAVPDSAPPARPAERPARPAGDYEPDDVPVGSARLVAPASAGRWGVFEAEIHGPAHGNPYVDVDLSAEFRQGDRVLRALGFHDGEVVDLVSVWEDGQQLAERRAEEFRIVAYATARGCAAAYFPETNVLVPLDSVAKVSNTPVSKSIVVRLEHRERRSTASSLR